MQSVRNRLSRQLSINTEKAKEVLPGRRSSNTPKSTRSNDKEKERTPKDHIAPQDLSLKKPEKVETKKDGSKKVIREMSEEEVRQRYKLGKQVMESTNTGMDVIFATRVKDHLQCVIKTRLRATSFKSSREEREWRATTEVQMNMPHNEGLCQIYEVIESPKYYYIVMEKCDGRDLFEQMQREKLTLDEAREVTRQILEALKVLHGEGRIHKDLKIENVVVDRDPKVAPAECLSPLSAKIIDFDTVISWEPESPRSKNVLGTDGYIAPEAYGGEYSPASDIFSIGVVLYKLLTRKFPYKPEIFDDKPGENYVGSKAMNRIRARLKKEVVNFVLPPLDKEHEARSLLRAMLSYDPENRPSAEEALNSPWFTSVPKYDGPKSPRHQKDPTVWEESPRGQKTNSKKGNAAGGQTSPRTKASSSRDYAVHSKVKAAALGA